MSSGQTLGNDKDFYFYRKTCKNTFLSPDTFFFNIFQYGRTLLQECVTLSDEDMVKSLIEYGEADVNAQNDVRKKFSFCSKMIHQFYT